MWKAISIGLILALAPGSPALSAGKPPVKHAQTAPSANLAPTPDTLLDWFFGTLTLGTGGPGGAADFEYVGTGAPSGFRFPHSPTVKLKAGKTYTFSVWCDASHTSGRAPFIGFYSPDAKTRLAFVEIPVKSAPARFSVTYTPTADTDAILLVDTSNSVVESGALLKFSQPQLELGPTATAYRKGSNKRVVYRR